LPWILSLKIFSILPLAEFRRQKSQAKAVAAALAALVLLSVPALIVQPAHSGAGVIRDWAQAATSENHLSPGERARNETPSLPGLALRALKIPVENSAADPLAALVCALIVGAWFFRASKNL